MTAPSPHRRAISWIAVTLVCAALLVSIALSYPRSITQPLLGKDWQCSRSAFFTSCSHTDRTAPVVNSRRTDRTAFWHA
jgi:hypothetical protein